jgi:hypothetical protein
VVDDERVSDDAARPDVFLQWKNTDACIDFCCACGAGLHFEGYFGGELTCGHCGQTWEMPHKLVPQAVEPSHTLKLVYDEAVLPEEPDVEFTVQWPRPAFDGAVPGSVVEIHDTVHLSEVASSGRAYYADLLKVQASGGMATLTLRVRSPVR